jgi:hypothetical protein
VTLGARSQAGSARPAAGWGHACPVRHLTHSAHTTEPQLFIEAPLQWGSEAAVTVAALLKLPLLGAPLRVPLTLRRLQLSVHARITVRPLLEEWPFAGARRDGAGRTGWRGVEAACPAAACFEYSPLPRTQLPTPSASAPRHGPTPTRTPPPGSVSVSLMAPPHIDFELPLRLPAFLSPPGLSRGGGSDGAPPELDLMALPLARGAFRAGVRLAAQRTVMYPRCWQVGWGLRMD